MAKLDAYREIVGDDIIEELYLLSKRLSGKVIQNINSTSVGGGVAEILNNIVPLLKDLGVDARWDVIKGDERFFQITKKMHNALHAVREKFTQSSFDYFLKVNKQNTKELEFYGDVIFVHDPQPVALVECKKKFGGKWAWRCHIDFSDPDKKLWFFLQKFIEHYDCAVFSAPAFARSLSIRQVLISPSIDPISDKNRELSGKKVESVFKKFGIDRSRPVVTQVSRFDYLKDPIGVIKAYRLVKKNVDCQLVLAGGGATDDPEGAEVLEKVKNEAKGDKDIFILLLPPASHLEINALQRGSTIVLQKSLREGFGLTVAEALWKARPVIASAVGGIPLQIKHEYSGILTHTIEGTAYWIKRLLNDPEYAKSLGVNGREHVKNHFLITRHLRDYLMLFLSLYYGDDIVHL
ncbi:MAG: glycosyltransferase [Deltaproteobacteria bacterium]|nr:glycosyltransferase [Deltaproteobacteria bacterium]